LANPIGRVRARRSKSTNQWLRKKVPLPPLLKMIPNLIILMIVMKNLVNIPDVNKETDRMTMMKMIMILVIIVKEDVWCFIDKKKYVSFLYWQ